MQPLKVDIPTIRDEERGLLASSFSSLTANPVTDELVGRYEKLIVWRPQSGGRVEALDVPDKNERFLLESRLADLRIAVRPSGLSMADKKRVGAAVARMFAGYPSQRNSDPQATVTTYVLELENVPAWAVERACDAVRLGKVSELNPDFPPSSVRLNQIAAQELEPVRLERGRIEALLDVVKSPSHRSEAEQAKAAESAAAWLERRDPRAKQLAEASRPSSAAELERAKERMEANRRFFERECRAAGIDPARGVSPSLLKTLGEANEF